jgi:2-keto-4-pentenoate hydratase/2-oxohepta-3-ene-1,7-dioic acid hydratase in catechol pathway
VKLGRIAGPDGPALVAVSSEGAVVLPQFRDLLELAALPSAELEAVVAAALKDGAVLNPDEISWLPPVTRPGKIVCVALNNSANPDRIISGPQTPAMFTKPATSLVGHNQPIRLREEYGRVHPEPELAVVIGRGGADIEVEDALSHVFGYTVFNDLTSPTMRGEDTFHYRAIHPDPTGVEEVKMVESWVTYPARYKGSDTFGPIGPYVVTRDDVPDPHALRVTLRHDGRLITDDTTANLRFSVAEVIAYASRFFTLEDGDVIAMGTALRRSAGGGAVQNLDLNQVRGTVEVEIEGIGRLSNPVESR